MAENGPRTSALEQRFNKAALDLERRIGALEQQMKILAYVAGLFGTVVAGVLTLLVIHVLL